MEERTESLLSDFTVVLSDRREHLSRRVIPRPPRAIGIYSEDSEEAVIEHDLRYYSRLWRGTRMLARTRRVCSIIRVIDHVALVRPVTYDEISVCVKTSIAGQFLSVGFYTVLGSVSRVFTRLPLSLKAIQNKKVLATFRITGAKRAVKKPTNIFR